MMAPMMIAVMMPVTVMNSSACRGAYTRPV